MKARHQESLPHVESTAGGRYDFCSGCRVHESTFRTVEKVTKYKPDAEFAYVYAEGIVSSVWNYGITSMVGGAQLEIAIDFIETARLMRWLKLLLQPILRHIINRNIDSFHVCAERKYAPNP